MNQTYFLKEDQIVNPLKKTLIANTSSYQKKMFNNQLKSFNRKKIKEKLKKIKKKKNNNRWSLKRRLNKK